MTMVGLAPKVSLRVMTSHETSVDFDLPQVDVVEGQARYHGAEAAVVPQQAPDIQVLLDLIVAGISDSLT